MTTAQAILNSKGKTIHSIAPDAFVLDALRMMAELNLGALIVLDEGKLSGIVSERDYARKIVLKGRTSPDTRVSEIMSTRVVCVTPTQTVEECMALMTARSIRHLPVLENKQVIGVISIGDLVKQTIQDQQFMIEQLEHYIHG